MWLAKLPLNFQDELIKPQWQSAQGKVKKNKRLKCLAWIIKDGRDKSIIFTAIFVNQSYLFIGVILLQMFQQNWSQNDKMEALHF